ncbi:MAG: OsmC family protein [Armatimonadota bacterium]|nr:OsmC family protein [Armatimonadota bacterium]MDR7449705.1 OsmC family protein [Armatimonadota bacterium]MDR7458378.1 OsmC family protein [Armatimonadota bacterium]MDR7478818.1 OsmC family protein [Armatimonadota bacterium]MDR7488841.1 OsmC family protein [Armatimonadota bacterium]
MAQVRVETEDRLQAQVRLAQEDRYRFSVAMDHPAWRLTVDEAPPLGTGAGPNPARPVATAVGHCLASSLQHCLERARVEGARLAVTVDVDIRRNARGRWRIGRILAGLDISGVSPAQRAAVERCRHLFEEFCIVTASVRQGIPVDVAVRVDGVEMA